VTLLWSDATESSIERILADLNDQEERASVFIIGRYNHLEPPKLSLYQNKFRNLDIDYITAHSSKGTQRDYVIIIGLTSKGYAFPSQIVDDPVLELVLAKKENVPNAEERRLFYVAVTRARKHVYLIASENAPSSFVVEISGEDYPIRISKPRSIGNFSCPLCKTGVILLRRGEFGEFFSCSNYPYCTYRPRGCPKCGKGAFMEGNNEYVCINEACSFKATKCPKCIDGYLVMRTGPYSRFFGCSNYPGCSYTSRLFQMNR